MQQEHKVTYRVYYEDTDAGGVVYYANYLKFAERARTEMLRDMGISQSVVAKEEGLLFVVRHAELDLQKPARLDHLLTVYSSVIKVGRASLQFLQRISDHETQMDYAIAKVTVACINHDFKPTRIPALIRSAFEKHI